MNINDTLKRVEENLFFQRYRDLGIKEALFSDTVAAVGHLQQKIVQRAMPNLIGRNIIDVRPTKESAERFPLASKAVGYAYSEGVACRLSGDKTGSVIVNMDHYAESTEQWSKEFIEDASPNAINMIERRISDALALDENEAVLDLYGSIADEDLAGEDALDWEGKAMDWNAVLKIHNAVRDENWKPTVLVLNETQLNQLLLDNRFIEYEYLPSKGTDFETGLIREALGMRVYSSTLMPAGTAYAIDKLAAGVSLVCWELTGANWSVILAGKEAL